MILPHVSQEVAVELHVDRLAFTVLNQMNDGEKDKHDPGSSANPHF